MKSYRPIALKLLTVSLLLGGCALHVRAPDPDLPANQPLAPSNEISNFAAVARLPLPMLAALLEKQALTPVAQADRTMLLAWSYQVERSGRVAAREQSGSLCFLVPFHGSAQVVALGGTLRKELDVAVDVCAKPRLSPSGIMTLQNPAVRVALDRVDFGGPAKPLLDNLAEKLEKYAGGQIATFIRTVQVPVGDYVTPTSSALYKPLPISDGACLQLRPLALRVAQPEVDPEYLRLALSIATQPTVEMPCGPAQMPKALPMAVDDELKHPETTLVLPIAVPLSQVRTQVLERLHALGRMPLGGKDKPDGGWVEVTDLKLISAQGALLVRAQIRGELVDKFLFIPFSRKIDGEFLVWGVPKVGPKDIELTHVQVDLQTDDKLNSLGAAIKRQEIAEIIAEKLRIPRSQIEGQARQVLASFSNGISVAGEKLPVRIDTRQLEISQVQTVGQRLEVLVRFAGFVVLGDTARR